ncbi:MaoC/PaaZ C-terminal domain-containing protein [Aureivirga marina]|uniref:MaoC/PaaZ C-terminal domain-containing protein n=1 Tax=Aureivirga marina TaxID=1182451 RepID=UPI0018CBADF0|nr:MaoC/PaaZ C-terminal domain-containing protein [Aureivirga marina]
MFPAYAKINQNEYFEVFGLNFEDFEIGQKFIHRPGITVSQQDNKTECFDTINGAWMHFDANYAKETEWKNCIGVSTLSVQHILGLTWKTFARKKRITTIEDITISKPFFAGDTIYAVSEIIDLNVNSGNDDCGEVLVRTSGMNQHNEVFTTIEYIILIYKKGHHPFYGHEQFNYNLKSDKFSAYYEKENNEWIERTGIYFEDLKKEEVYHHFPFKYITQEEAIHHSLKSGNWNPKYIDPLFSKSFMMENKIPISEAFILSIVCACTTKTFGRVVANLGWKNIHFSREVYPEEEIRVVSKVLSKRNSKSRPDQGILNIETYWKDEKGDKVVSFERTLLMYKKDKAPYKNAGYS